jgi:lambda repressor-like predicted transcriptional regulator
MSWALIRRHERANLAIAEFLDLPAHELWPTWYPPISPSAPKSNASARKESRIPTKAA